jgi:predicted ATP-dependent protease
VTTPTPTVGAPALVNARRRVAGRRLDPSELYRPCSAEAVARASEAEPAAAPEPVGQARALEALLFGVRVRRQGYHVFALGPPGLGKHSAVRRILREQASRESAPADWCYVYDFADPRRPTALQMPSGTGAAFARDMARLVDELHASLPAAFQSEDYRTRRKALEEGLKARQEQAFAEVDKEAAAAGVAVIRGAMGVALAPTRGGEVLSPEEFEQLPAAEQERLRGALRALQEKVPAVLAALPRLERQHRDRLRELDREVAASAVAHLVDDLRARYAAQPAVLAYVQAVREDVLENTDEFLATDGDQLPAVLRSLARHDHQAHRYQVNVLVTRSEAHGAPVVEEDLPTHARLLGCAEHRVEMGTLVTDFRLVKAGALHRANGGYLVLDARRVLLQPFAWEGLKQALRSRQLRIESPAQALGLVSTLSIEPEPIPLDVKVVLVGDRFLYYLLAELDPEFQELFKVAADFESAFDRTPESEAAYASFLASRARQEGLLPLQPAALARLIEETARLSSDAARLSADVEAVLDLAREADHVARSAGRAAIETMDLEQSLAAQIRRADRPRERLFDAVRRRTILVDTEGYAAGQVNGLSVVQLGRFTFGYPVRITARARLGGGRVVDVEREAELGGPIHSKGVLILAGFLAGRYLPEQPLSLAASLVFEQSYGTVEGDSASAAELIALLSALAGEPVDQGLAVTGAVNQLGQVQAVGGVNEKIEGFFEVCRTRGLTGAQGVVIPAANAAELMLRREVVEAVRQGRFHVYAIEDVDEGLELLTGAPAGERGAGGRFPDGTVNARVEARLAAFAQQARAFRTPATATEPEAPRRDVTLVKAPVS